MSKFIICIRTKYTPYTFIEFNNFNDAKEYYKKLTKYDVDIYHFNDFNYDFNSMSYGEEEISIYNWNKIDKKITDLPIKQIQLFLRNNNIKEILS